MKVSFTPSAIITPAELTSLRHLASEINALQDRCTLLYNENWARMAARAREDFRKNATGAGADALLSLLMQSPETSGNHRAFEAVRTDLTLGAQHLFSERGRPLLSRVLARAERHADADLAHACDHHSSLAEDIHAHLGAQFDGDLPKTKRVVELEAQKEQFKLLRAQLETPTAPSQFPVSIEEFLAKLGIGPEVELHGDYKADFETDEAADPIADAAA